MADQRQAALGRVTLPPFAAAQPVTEFEVLRLEAVVTQVKPADELIGVAPLRSEVPEPGLLRVDLEPARQVGLDVARPRRRHAERDVAHHLGVRVEVDEPVDVVGRKMPQPQPLRLQ